jgi:phosphopantetheinyl transferase
MMRWREHLVSMNAVRRLLRADALEKWCTPGELERLKGFRSPRRAEQWLSGRWLAKYVLATTSTSATFSPREVHIESRDARNRASRPLIYLRGQLQSWTVSIAHSDDVLYVAAAMRLRARVGVDVVPLQPLPQHIADFWFTTKEQQWCARTGSPYAACLVWALKEAYFKAHNNGEPFRPRRIDILTETPLARWDNLPVALSAPGRRFVYEDEDERHTFLIRSTSREITTLVGVS